MAAWNTPKKRLTRSPCQMDKPLLEILLLKATAKQSAERPSEMIKMDKKPVPDTGKL
jgi:hypothetical protein